MQPVSEPVPNFGTIPHLFLDRSGPADSWWAEPMSRDEFMSRAAAEFQRMRASRGAWMVETTRLGGVFLD